MGSGSFTNVSERPSPSFVRVERVEQVPPKYWVTVTRLVGITLQKTEIFVVITMRI